MWAESVKLSGLYQQSCCTNKFFRFVFLVSGTVTAVILTVAAAAVFLWYHHMAMHEFGGTTGDLAGYFLQTAELAMIAALAVCSRI